MSESFIKQLGKGFVRSTVNQIGRDTGKVISNQIYGDKHATPIRKVGKDFISENKQGERIVLSPAEFRQIIEDNGYKIAPLGKCKNIGVAIFWVVWGFIPLLGILSTINFFVWAVASFKGTIFKGYVNKSIISSDKRYKGGYRVDGIEVVEDFVTLPPTDEEKNRNIAVGIVFILLAIGLACVRWFLLSKIGNLS